MTLSDLPPAPSAAEPLAAHNAGKTLVGYRAHKSAGVALEPDDVDGNPIGKVGAIVVNGGKVPEWIRELFPTAIGVASDEPGVLRIVHT